MEEAIHVKVENPSCGVQNLYTVSSIRIETSGSNHNEQLDKREKVTYSSSEMPTNPIQNTHCAIHSKSIQKSTTSVAQIILHFIPYPLGLCVDPVPYPLCPYPLFCTNGVCSESRPWYLEWVVRVSLQRPAPPAGMLMLTRTTKKATKDRIPAMTHIRAPVYMYVAAGKLSNGGEAEL